jgi:subtilisin-like proprotein convertase family protein
MRTTGGILRTAASIAAILSLAIQSWAVVFSNPASITVNDATTIGIGNPYSSDIAVSGLTGNITSVTVSFTNVNHTFTDDFDILLAGPTGANLIVMSDVGGSDDISNVSVTIDDGAATPMADATKLNSGTYQPTNVGTGDTWPAPAPAPSANTTLAAAFGGTAPNGTWSLFVVDDLGADMGTLSHGWSVRITTTGSPATTFSNTAAIFGGDGAKGRANTYGSSIVASGLTGAITDLNVTLTNFNHLNPDDVDILLVGPSGKRILLMSDAGGTTDVVNVNLTFDDGAAAVIPDAGPVITASVRPSNFGTGDTLPDLLPPYPNSSTAGSATLASVFNGTQPNGTWRLYVVDDATTSAGTFTGGWSIDVTAGGTFGAKRFTNGDFTGDGKTDAAIYRPSDGFWWTRNSSTYANIAAKWGAPADIPMPGDYDGDGTTDLTVFRPATGQWIAINSGTSTVSFATWGVSTDKAVPADYDGDGKTDLAIFRPTGAQWWVRQSGSGATRVLSWGLSSDVPVRGHFEGTDGADFTVFRPSENNWYILNNAGSTSRVVNWGTAGDNLAHADYDCDGKTDIAVFRPSSGDWWAIRSSNSSILAFHWGQNGDTPVPGDYDGDSCADIAIWRSTEANWYLQNSGTPVGAASLRSDNWGLPGDIPLPTTYIAVQ